MQKLKLVMIGNGMAGVRTLEELLKLAPGVWADDNGSISINGKSGAKVLINEREVRMTNEQLMSYLRSLPAENLQRIEIIPQSGFYAYNNKYQGGCTTEICPAPLTEDEAKRLADSAKAVFAALRLENYSRIDFILDAEGIFWCLEANTLPGMTPTSLLPQAARAVGISYENLCEQMIRLALK